MPPTAHLKKSRKTVTRTGAAAAPEPPRTSTRVQGIRTIESVISPTQPNLGLQLFAAHEFMINAFALPQFSLMEPVKIGIPALLTRHPGISQQELADMMGLQRAITGLHVQRCIAAGLITRKASQDDGRKYRLFITGKGAEYLKSVAALTPHHEQHCFGALSSAEQAQLYHLLGKMVDANSAIAEPLFPVGAVRAGANRQGARKQAATTRRRRT